MNNAKCHSRLIEKRPTMNMKKKNDMILFMASHHIEIPSPLPIQPVLLQKICEINIPKKRD